MEFRMCILWGGLFSRGMFLFHQNFLPDFISKIASFTPTYWFVQNNQLIGNTLSVNADFITKFWLNCLILVLFACAFLIIQFVLKKDSRWFNQKKGCMSHKKMMPLTQQRHHFSNLTISNSISIVWWWLW